MGKEFLRKVFLEAGRQELWGKIFSRPFGTELFPEAPGSQLPGYYQLFIRNWIVIAGIYLGFEEFIRFCGFRLEQGS